MLSHDEAVALLEKYGVTPGVMEHINAVHKYAMEIADQIECDKNLVDVGSLLHDIGRTRTHNIDHNVVGAKILRDEGIDDRIIKIVERHVGAGLTPEEAEKLGLPPGDYVPETIEEKIVGHADNLIGSNERVSILETIKIARDKWFSGSVDRLIQFHFEVFTPSEISFSVDSVTDKEKFRTTMENLDVLLKDYDVLYKVMRKGKYYTISLYGQESGKAGEFLIKELAL